jgi:hypothetical protein
VHTHTHTHTHISIPAAIFQELYNLRVLDVQGCKAMPLDDVFANCGSLRKLHSLLVLSDHSLTDVGLMHIGQLTTLRRLHLVDATMSEHGLHALAGLSELEVLELPCWAGTRPTGFMKTLQALLHVFPKLQSLDISEIHPESKLPPDELHALHWDDDLTDDDVEFVKLISGFPGLLVSIGGWPVLLKRSGYALLKMVPGHIHVCKDSDSDAPFNYSPYHKGGGICRGSYDDCIGTRPIRLETGEARIIPFSPGFFRPKKQTRAQIRREQEWYLQIDADAELHAWRERRHQRRQLRLQEEMTEEARRNEEAQQ